MHGCLPTVTVISTRELARQPVGLPINRVINYHTMSFFDGALDLTSLFLKGIFTSHSPKDLQEIKGITGMVCPCM